jgi:hypothetical protein
MQNEFVVAIIGMVMIILVVVIWQSFVTVRARAALAREDEYRGLSARAVVAEENASRRLEEISAELAKVNSRLDSVERMLTVVE